MKKWKFAVVALAAAVIAYRIIGPSLKNSKKAAPVPAPVETAKSRRADLWEKIELTGDVRGYYEAKVFPKVPGKLNRRIKNAGDKVSRDDTVAMVDRDEPALEYALAEVKSPLDGIITRYFVNEGETVSPQSPVAEVASTEKIKVVVQVSEKDIVRVASGQSAKFYVDSYPSKVFSGQVENISRSIDAMTRTSAVEISAANPDGILRPGMFARVEILTRAHPGAVVVPRTAVIFNPAGENVLFIVSDGVARRRVVRLGLSGIEAIEVLSGVAAGESVITLGQYALVDGDKVNVCVEGVCPSY